MNALPTYSHEVIVDIEDTIENAQWSTELDK